MNLNKKADQLRRGNNTHIPPFKYIKLRIALTN